jgi:hypothetical protein
MNFFFSIFSVAYITGIFLFADSPIVSAVAPFNPYSLLHIPLYGILTFLLIFSKWSSISINRGNSTNSTNPKNSINSMKPTNPINSRNLFIAGLIALVVAIADEIHQAYVPGRHASIIDVFLDTIGIGLCVLVARRFR